jgi:NAD+ kinase
MLRLKTVGVLLRDGTDPAALEEVRPLFDRQGIAVRVLDSVGGGAGGALDLVIAMGGDGTVLKALDLMPGCPVLAINFGTVGFLTAGDRTELAALVERLLRGEYIVSERLLLRCEYPGGVTHVVNEIVLRSTWRMMQVDVDVNGARIRTIRGDGVIVGTPTGSTGYLLSAGAPIVMPDVQCFVLDGINEYNFTSRAVILAPDSLIRLRVGSLLPGQRAEFMADGNLVGDLQPGQDLLLTRSDRRAQLIFFDEHYFFHNLQSRLRW